MEVLRMIGQRIEAVRGKTSREAFASSLGVHAQTLARYEKGERLPDSAFLEKLAKRYGVAASWLLTGSGPMHDNTSITTEKEDERKNAIEKRTINLSLLTSAIKAVEWGLAEANREMDVSKKAELISAVYELLSEEENIDTSRIIRLICAAA